jgi:hypothetical protein
MRRRREVRSAPTHPTPSDGSAERPGPGPTSRGRHRGRGPRAHPRRTETSTFAKHTETGADANRGPVPRTGQTCVPTKAHRSSAIGDDASAPVAREPPRRSFRTRRRTFFHRYYHKTTRVSVATAAVRRARTAPGPSSRVPAPSSSIHRRASTRVVPSLDPRPSRHPPSFPLHSSSLSSVSSSLPSSSSGPSSPPSSAKGLRHAGHWNASPPMSRSRP